MNYPINDQQKFDDVVFANRNKNYGAYFLRSTYGNAILKSLSLMIFGVISFFSIAFYMTNKKDSLQKLISTQIPIQEKIYETPVDLEPEKKPDEAPKNTTPEKQNTNNANSLNANVKLNDSLTVKTESNTIENIIQPPSVNTGTPGNAISPDKSSASTGSSSSVTTNNSKKIKTTVEVDSGPEFEGGLKALYQFVGSHLRYPDFASSEGKEGTVYVNFVVDENGMVGDLSLLNQLGYGLDDEALRVVAMIPKFKSPAKIKGEAVKVNYHLPIKFKLR